jgi:hypothetical protein
MSSKEDGIRDAEKGREDPFSIFFDPEYEEGVGIGKGIRKGKEARKRLEKHPIEEIIAELTTEPFERAGLSEKGDEAFRRIKRGERKRQVCNDLSGKSSSGGGSDGFYRKERKWDKSSDFGGSGGRSSITDGALGITAVALLGVVSLGVWGIIGGYNRLNDWLNRQNEKYRTPAARPVPAMQNRIQNRERTIQGSLENWINNNLKYPNQKDLIAEYPVKISLEDYSVVGSDIWAACYRKGYGGMGHLIHSQDGGRSWEILYRDDNANFEDVHFCDSHTGFLASRNGVYKSGNGGRSWEKFVSIHSIPNLSFNWIKGIDVKSENNISIKLEADSRLVETNNGGRTWEYVNYQGRGYGSSRVNIRKPQFISHDEGRSWEKVPEASKRNSKYR